MRGVFDPQNWIEEGDGLLASARTMRAAWSVYRRNLKRQKNIDLLKKHMDWPKLTGMPRASMLLLSYATEMYLKAGLAKACRGCSEEFFNFLSERKYGHRLHALAGEIEFPFADVYGPDLSTLNKMITETARYPLKPKPGIDFSQQINARTRSIWDRTSFKRYCIIANEIRAFAIKLDQDSKNPAFFVGYQIDKTGYFASRIGGGLRPRMTFRYSDEMKNAGKADIEALRELLDRDGLHRVTRYWQRYKFIEDTGPPYKR
ncbi:hypothetical protein [Methylobacterium sp. 174MFSha1.1]|uniref:hypothetical protein n=1 Tax=Methylobacterium sp. 174MFSha1.1 TaxID=1502749 RepID=UPI001160913B|nr:hypothetical protein [Methylobacterium sp. 174MFSha1.1]